MLSMWVNVVQHLICVARGGSLVLWQDASAVAAAVSSELGARNCFLVTECARHADMISSDKQANVEHNWAADALASRLINSFHHICRVPGV